MWWKEYRNCASDRNGMFLLRNDSFNWYSYSNPEDWRIRSWFAISVTLPQLHCLTYLLLNLNNNTIDDNVVSGISPGFCKYLFVSFLSRW